MQTIQRLVFGMFAVGLFLLNPATARASSPWGWLDKLSGPGPFDANGRLFLPVPGTTNTKDGIVAFAHGIDERRLYVVFETARFTGETNPNFVGAVNITTLQGVVFLHPEGWRNATEPSALSALDVGAGFGLYRFSGAGVISDGKPDGAFWRGVIPIRIRLTPSELFANKLKGSRWRNGLAVFSYMIGWDVIPGTFDTTDFVVPPSNPGYHSSGNAPFTCGIIVDITPVLFK
jgi:hypothetical protein